MPNLPKPKNCTGCMACLDTCPKGAIRLAAIDGHMCPQVDASMCVECGACTKHCPQLTDRNWNRRDEVNVFGGWCKDLPTRQRSASGGAFAALALSVLRAGGCVAGASLNADNSVSHRIIDKVEDLPLLQNSKYVQSNASGIYREVKRLLHEGRQVLFSGTPCQVGAMNSYLGQSYDNLLTLDVVCNGVPGDEALDSFFSETDAQKIVSFRDKDFGWVELNSQKMVYRNREETRISCDRPTDPFYKIFACGLTQRVTCCHCKYASLPRYSDFTVADFWGIRRFSEEWQDGISLIVCNNPRAVAFLNQCRELHFFEASLAECIPANPRLINGHKYLDWHPVMMWRNAVRKVVGHKIYMNIIRNHNPYRLLWGALKVLTIASNKRKMRKELRYEQKNRHSNDLQGQ